MTSKEVRRVKELEIIRDESFKWLYFEESFLSIFAGFASEGFLKTVALEMNYILIVAVTFAKEIGSYSYLGKKGIFGEISQGFARSIDRDLIALTIPGLIRDELGKMVNLSSGNWRNSIKETFHFDDTQIKILERLLRGPFDVDVKLNISTQKLQELSSYSIEKYFPNILYGDIHPIGKNTWKLRVSASKKGSRECDLIFRKHEIITAGKERKVVLEFEFYNAKDKFSIQITNLSEHDDDFRQGSGLPDSQRRTVFPLLNLSDHTENDPAPINPMTDDADIMIGIAQEKVDHLKKPARVEKITNNFSLAAISALRLVAEYCLLEDSSNYGINNVKDETRLGFVDAFAKFSNAETLEIENLRVEEICTWPIVVMKANPQKALELLIGLGYFIPIKHAPEKFKDINLIKDKTRVIKLAEDVVKGEEKPFSTYLFKLIKFFDPRFFKEISSF